MRIDILTIFPEFFKGPLDYGIMRRAREAGLIETVVHNLRAFAGDRHQTVDDRPFGGGEGMVLKPEPIFQCLESLHLSPFRGAEGIMQPVQGKQSIVLLSAQGKLFRQAAAEEMAQLGRLVLICGRYEGDEVWRYLPPVSRRPESVHLAAFFADGDVTGGIRDLAGAERLRAEWAQLMAVRGEVLKALEEARNAKFIGGSLEAMLTLAAPAALQALLTQYEKELRALFIVSAVQLEPGGALEVRVSRAQGRKCERCWNYSVHVGEDAVYPTVCERCSAALADMERRASASNH